MTTHLKRTICICALAAPFFSGSAQAYIPDSSGSVDFALTTHISSYNTDVTHVPRVLSSDELAMQEMSLKVPVDLQNYNSQTTTINSASSPSADNHAAAAHVLDQNVNRILKSEQQRGSALGQAGQLQNALQTNLALGGGEDGSIKHEIKFKINAASGSAVMNYSGFMNAQLSYDLGHDGAMRAAIIHHLDKDTNLVIDHTTKVSDRTDRVSVAWNF